MQEGSTQTPSPTGGLLGPFALDRVIGRGATGEVWEGVHREHGVPVAVKVLTDSRAKDAVYAEAFRNEIRSVATFDHPNIIAILDFGTVPVGVAGPWTPGSPFFAMELAAGGSLKSLCGRIGWEDVREILNKLLAALAHAHARGVIHRDLKPGNVLLGGLRPGVKLTDFGLAHLIEEDDALDGDVVGTPAYMAPEQFEARWRDFGPWTDLYALGCLAWSLVCGVPPYGRQSPLEVRRGHLYRPLPPLAPVVAVPVTLEAWLHRLLDKDPDRRFRRAADAAWALSVVEGPLVPPTGEPLPLGPRDGGEANAAPTTHRSRTFPTTTTLGDGGSSTTTTAPSLPSMPMPPAPPAAEATLAGRLDTASMTWMEPGLGVPAGVGETNASGASPLPLPTPPPPETWRSEDSRAEPLLHHLGIAGLALFGLRTIPLVDREPERDALWAALRRVSEGRRAEAVILTGPAGYGKSRLAEWLSERAHELGAAIPLRATGSPTPGPSEGLGPMVARALRCAGLSREAMLARTQTLLARQGVSDTGEATSLVALMAEGDALEGSGSDEGTDGADSVLRPAGLEERYAVLRRLLQRATRERAVVLWLDDVIWSLDALRFAASLQDSQGEDAVAVLVLLTVREEALPERPMEAGLLTALAARPGVTSLHIGPLPPLARPALVRALLNFEGPLAAELAQRTAGNPLFAVQLVGDWVERGLLEVAPRGLRICGDADIAIPDNLREVWASRVHKVLSGRPDPTGDRLALELAATLGQEILAVEWRAVCRKVGLEAPMDLVPALVEARLAREDGEPGLARRWGLVHGMLRESLLAEADAEGRLAGHHQVCAAALAMRTGRSRGGLLDERIGRHRLAAGDLEGALEPLLAAAKARTQSGDYGTAELLLAERERALQNANLPKEDSRWGEGWFAHASLCVFQGRFEEAEVLYHQLVEASSARGWASLLGSGRFGLASLLRQRGHPREAWPVLEAVSADAQARGDTHLQLRTLREMARIRMDEGTLSSAEGYLHDALRLAVRAGDLEREGLGYRDLAILHLRAGRIQSALQHVKAARARFSRCGYRWGIADAFNMLGEIDRVRGRNDRARQNYQGSVDRFRAIGSYDIIIPQLNLAALALGRADTIEAGALLAQAAAIATRIRSRNLLLLIEGMRLWRAALQGDFELWRHHLAMVTTGVEETGILDSDLADALESAGERMRVLDRSQDAIAAWRLAFSQWQRLGRGADASRVASLLASLGAS